MARRFPDIYEAIFWLIARIFPAKKGPGRAIRQTLQAAFVLAMVVLAFIEVANFLTPPPVLVPDLPPARYSIPEKTIMPSGTIQGTRILLFQPLSVGANK